MTSMERVLAAIGHKRPDRVPLFLMLTMHGAREVGVSIKDYFSDPENVVEGQLRMLARYRHDCVYSFFYAPIEIEAWGGEVIYTEDGPPNSGAPIINMPGDIMRLNTPKVKERPCLVKVLKAQRMLKKRVGEDVPIIGVVMSPFSLPVMQMGFGGYIEIMTSRPDLFDRLMDINEQLCVEWANAQLEAGASVICYFDPVSSSTVISRDMYLNTGFKVAQRAIAAIKGPTATHMASGRCLPIVNDIVQTGTAIIGTSSLEDLTEVKSACRGKVTIMGNLNGIEMRRWTLPHAEQMVKAAIAKAGPGGGFILSDHHGEIPFQVPEEVISAVSDAVHKWGRYPLKWTKN